MKTSLFDLEKVLKGKPVVTRDGRKVLEIHKFNINVLEPLAVVLEDSNSIHTYHINGKYFLSENSDDDLFMLEPDEKREGLNFGEALEAMKDGKHITRACWKNKAIQVFIRFPSFEKDVRELRVITIQGQNCPWMPNHQELLADDWEIV